MVLIRYVDIIDTIPVEGGYVEKVTVSNATIPIIVDSDKVGPIQPFFSKRGKLYKNVSYLSYEGDIYKVVGNYKELNKKVKENESHTRIKITGYKDYDSEQREASIENRAKTKSKIK